MGIHEHLFDVEASKRRLQECTGGYEFVHVSPGLGTSKFAPFRFLCPPEATLLELRPAPADQGPARSIAQPQ